MKKATKIVGAVGVLTLVTAGVSYVLHKIHQTESAFDELDDDYDFNFGSRSSDGFNDLFSGAKFEPCSSDGFNDVDWDDEDSIKIKYTNGAVPSFDIDNVGKDLDSSLEDEEYEDEYEEYEEDFYSDEEENI